MSTISYGLRDQYPENVNAHLESYPPHLLYIETLVVNARIFVQYPMNRIKTRILVD